MPIDSRLIPALEEELAWAKKNLPGGQIVRDERIAAIEAELEKYRTADAHVDPEPENLSNVPNDYQDDDTVERAEQDVAKKKAKKVVEEAAVAPEPEPLETADAGVPLETTEA